MADFEVYLFERYLTSICFFLVDEHTFVLVHRILFEKQNRV